MKRPDSNLLAYSLFSVRDTLKYLALLILNPDSPAG